MVSHMKTAFSLGDRAAAFFIRKKDGSGRADIRVESSEEEISRESDVKSPEFSDFNLKLGEVPEEE